MNQIACIHTSPWPTVQDWPPLGRVADGLIIVNLEQNPTAPAAETGSQKALNVQFLPARSWRKRLRRNDPGPS